MAIAVLAALLVGLTVLFFFVALWRLFAPKDEVAERLDDYGVSALPAAPAPQAPGGRFGRLNRWILRAAWGNRLAEGLAQADVPLTAAEYALIICGAFLLGLLLGALRLNLIAGLLLGAVFAYIPIFYLRRRRRRRQQAFSDQLPDVLTLLVGALRAGYGLSQAIEVVVERLPPPSSVEFGRVLRAMGLGVPLQRALNDMARRVDNDDLDLMVTAINVQYELGGNLAQVLDNIGETIRERIRILREVRVLTAQQRLTGYILAGLPIFLAVALSIMSPGYFASFFEPGLARLIPIAGLIFMFFGFLLIRRIVDIEV
jgi:tight adherence protein B